MSPRRPDEVSAGGVVARRTAAGWEVALLRAGRHWGLAKGNVEAGEGPEGAALREASEECGISPSDLRLRGELPGSDYAYRRDGRLVFKHVDHFLIEAASGAELHPQADEIDEAEWLDLETAIARASFRDTVAALTAARHLLH